MPVPPAWGADPDALGEPLASYRPRWGRLLVQFAFSLVLFAWFPFVVAAAFTPDRPGTKGLLIFAVLLAAGGGAGMYTVWKDWRVRVLLFPKGVVRVVGRTATGFRWADVVKTTFSLRSCEWAEVEQTADGSPETAWLPFPPPPFLTGFTYLRLERRDGVFGTFTASLTDYENLLTEIQRQLFWRAWPGVWERFQAGESIEFGTIALDRDGITTPTGTAAWQTVKSVAIKDHGVVIHKRKRTDPWHKSDVYEVIPDWHILLPLAEEARRHGS